MSTESYQQHLTSLGIDPATVVVDDGGTVTLAEGELSPATPGELPVLAIDDPGDPPPGPPELRLEDQLGQGGMGMVFSATQIPLRRRVAVKVPHHEGGGGPVAHGHLLREALVTGSLEHPNIVPVHALGLTSDGRPMLVMKQIEGTPWRRSMRPLFADDEPAEPAVVEEQLQILVQVCRAVEFAHSRGIIHRDIKPDNVMIGSFGEVYLLDWGLAVSLRPGTGLPHIAQVQAVAGTPGYMAPEMAAGNDAIDERADLYQLGAVLHELCIGTKRNPGDSVVDKLAAAHDSRPVDYGEAMPTDLAAICNRATARRPGDRFDSAAQLREALVAFIQRRGARRLLEEAQSRLDAFEDALGRDPIKSTFRSADINTLATEARFGFRLVLRQWPQSTEARQGLQLLLERMVELELSRENRAAAASLIAELPEARPGLQRRFESLGQQLRARKAKVRALERMRDDADLSVTARQRRGLTIALGAVLALSIGLLFGLRLLGMYEPGYPDAMGVVTILGLGAAASRIRLRRQGGNLANLRQMDAIIATSVCLLALFGSGMAGGVPFFAALSAAMILGAATSAIVALMTERRLLPMMLGFLAAGILAAIVPKYRGLFLAVGSLASFGYAGWVWSRFVDRSHDE